MSGQATIDRSLLEYFWREKIALADMSYDVIFEFGAESQGSPIRQSDWLDPARHRNPSLVRAMKREGRTIDALLATQIWEV